ncbi:MAG: hypothetical protein QNJ92_01315 [Alphaproteobacteria bacterium]|nr:hypothetical protein [Alphaproteobacteria bacterium]
MSIVLWLGSALGAAIGLLHAGYIYRQEVTEVPPARRERPFATRARAAYFALWAFALWVVFGSYLLVLWLLAVIAHGVYRVVAPTARAANV